MTDVGPLREADLSAAGTALRNLESVLSATVVGQEDLIRDLLCGVFAAGHVLLEGLPGLGKTRLANALARALGVGVSRVQCTPDLMPADITGSEVLQQIDGTTSRLEFRPGPIFAALVLVDEINRATPRTQSAFLEAMQERQVTCAGQPRPLADPFWLIATQNPIELEGTFALPEAQLDRFICKLSIAYPDAAALMAMLDVALDDKPASTFPQVMEAADCLTLLHAARQVVIAEPLRTAAVALIQATQPDSTVAAGLAARHFRYGASPRGLQALLRMARVRALQNDRVHVAFADLRDVAPAALRHRVLLRIESEMDGVQADTVLAQLIATCLQGD